MAPDLETAVSVFRHIVVATDFQPSSARALTIASHLAARDGAQLTLLNIYSAPVLMPTEEGSVVLEKEAELQSYAQRELERLVTSVQLLGPGVRVNGVARKGEAKHEIVLAAEELGADLVVLGTHGKSGLARVLLGSVAEHVVRNCPVPVLTVRSPEA